jgi:hypothetical protein
LAIGCPLEDDRGKKITKRTRDPPPKKEKRKKCIGREKVSGDSIMYYPKVYERGKYRSADKRYH